ncbi:ISKra4-like element ISKra2 family transposase [Ktedonobacter racemifer]|uniref:ISKra4 family transposase n=1 Tax=Ktedonobacter racemifer DSM 44963 TaxID=485913 RepID=D6TLQ2_KTERA|nr:ISKra4-like element ISKra2 family transposase [Ktedonobacter racemifer]EFH86702.1 hypothetical protein Krac_8013 [Ktedonobacter racemifer DSM 44963]EFH87826.1 hypothetical protein Krac_9177 [Ktedonobacter racemifer DSM 44963]
MQLKQVRNVTGVVPQPKSAPPVPCVAPHCKPVGNDPAVCKEQEDKRSRSAERTELAPRVGQGFFPLDEELALPRGRNLTSLQHEHLVHLSSWMPFARAAEMMQRLLGVQVSEASARRQSEQAGALALAVQTVLASEPFASSPSVSKPTKRLAISADGAYVPLLKGQWAEVRTVAFGEVEPSTSPAGAQEVTVSHLSYFSRMCDAQTFATLADVEMRERGVRQAQEIGAVTDGAEWLQGFLNLHCPQALRILDFPHAAEHLHLLIQALQQAGLVLPDDLLERACHRLKHRGPRLLIWLLARLPAQIAQQEGVREQVGYFLKREALMQYPQFQAAGWPIGSGMVESANKVVVQARLKGAGMHWEPSHVNPMLTLRNAVCNERWDLCWQEIEQEQLRQREQRRNERATPRLEQMVSSLMLSLLRFRSPTPKPLPPPPRPMAPAATLPGSSRPSTHHPWKRVLACRPKSIAKR